MKDDIEKFELRIEHEYDEDQEMTHWAGFLYFTKKFGSFAISINSIVSMLETTSGAGTDSTVISYHCGNEQLQFIAEFCHTDVLSVIQSHIDLQDLKT